MHKNKLKNTILACSIAGIITLGGTASEAALGDRVLYQGVRHNDVKELQQGLRQLNFFKHGTNTTYFGNITKQALKNFQKANGLAVDGAFGPNTSKVLKQKLNTTPQSSAPAPRPSASAGTLTYTRTLKNGSRGNDVRALQQALAKLGHYKIKVDNIYGNGARSAVMSFQRAQGIAVDGIAGPGTIRTLNNVITGKVKAGKPTAAPSRNESGRSTAINIVNRAKQYLGSRYVYGGTSPSGFDCSGFTSYVYRQSGISLPRTTTGQAGAGSRLSKSQLEPGDLLIFSNTYRPGPSHAGVYIGNGQFVHAANPSKGVRTDSINSSYYSGKFSYGRRVF